MLEIIALIFLTRNIGNLAARKGLKTGWWKFYTVIAWFGAEVIGVFVGFLLFQETGMVAAMLLGYGAAIASYFILKTYLSRKPDVVDPAFEFEAQNQPQQ